MSQCFRRLNGVVSFLIVVEELSQVTSFLFHVTRRNRDEQDFRCGRRRPSFLSSGAHGASPFFQTRETVSGFQLFVVWTFLHVPRMHCDSFIAWDENLVSLLVCFRIKCHIELIHLSVFLPPEYSVLLSFG